MELKLGFGIACLFASGIIILQWQRFRWSAGRDTEIARNLTGGGGASGASGTESSVQSALRLPRLPLTGVQAFGKPGPCPKVFAYPLPDEWLKKRVLPGRNQADPVSPDPFGNNLWPERKGYHGTKHKSAPSVFEYLLHAYGDLCLVDEPENAEVFFIPWYRDYFCGVRPCDYYTKETAEEQQLFQHIQNHTEVNFGVNYFTRRNGRDHFMLVMSEAATALVPKDMKWFRGYYRNLTTFSAGYGSVMSYPFATAARFEAGMAASELPWRYRLGEEAPRKRLLFMAFGALRYFRTELLRQCEAAGDKEKVCWSSSIDRKTFHNETANSDKALQIFVNEMKESVFCAEVGGDFCSRRGFIESIVLGCIPLVFTFCPLEHYSRFMDVHKVALLLPRHLAKAGLVEYLRSLPEWEIKTRQLYMAQHAHTLQYSRIDKREDYDALEPALRNMVHEDAFFRILRLVAETANRARTCEDENGGHFQARFGVCCERPKLDDQELAPSCNPLAIVAGGAPNSCASRKGVPPCFFDFPQLTDQVVPYTRDEHHLEDGDYLYNPIPWRVISPQNYTTKTTYR